jgi:uncharacterized protein YjbJ (UPF0337 family)
MSEMHKDEAKGAAKDIKGSMKEAAGKATGNERWKPKAPANAWQARSRRASAP